MNWLSVLKNSLFLLSSFILACSSGGAGSPTTINGILVGIYVGAITTETFTQIASSAVLGVEGRGKEFKFNLDDASRNKYNLIGVPFSISSAPFGETLVFSISSGQTDSTLTFPYKVGSNLPLVFPVLGSGTIANVVDMAINGITIASVTYPPVVVSVDLLNKSMIIGAMAPDGQQCGTIVGVDLLSKATGASVLTPTNMGPFYFNTVGALVSSGISDPQCSYVIFNVLPGAYYLAATEGASQTRQSEVLALAGKTVVGYGIPGE